MGRTPLGMKEYKVQLAPKVVEQVDALVGTYRRSAFIRDAMVDAVERELERRGNAAGTNERSPDTTRTAAE